MIASTSATSHRWKESLKTSTRGIAFAGYALIAVFLGGFGIWSATAPLASAVIVPGVVEAAGSNIDVQHLDGGLIRDVHVAEGDLVLAGAPLITLEGAASRARLESYMNQWVGLLAGRSRLTAERDGDDNMVFDDDTQALAARHDLVSLLQEQRNEFEAGLALRATERTILEQRVAAIEQSLVGYDSQRDALTEQRDLISEEAERKLGLLSQGLATRSEHTALMRTLADLVGQIGSLNATIEQARLRIVEAEAELARLEIDRVAQATVALSELSREEGRLAEQIIAERQLVERLTITAPVDGTIVRLPQAAVGNVIGSGAVVAELLPVGSDLVVETQLEPDDVDVVHEGQRAQLRLVALNRRTTPEIGSTVDFISADRLRDDVSGQEFFAARMSIAGTLPPEIDAGSIYPGMPVEVVIPIESRTFLQYLVTPITDSLQHAFKET